MECKKAQEFIPEYLSLKALGKMEIQNEMPGVIEFEAHLKDCAVCSEALREFRDVVEGVSVAFSDIETPDISPSRIWSKAVTEEERIMQGITPKTEVIKRLIVPALAAGIVLFVILKINGIKNKKEILDFNEEIEISSYVDVLEEFQVLENIELLDNMEIIDEIEEEG